MNFRLLMGVIFIVLLPTVLADCYDADGQCMDVASCSAQNGVINAYHKDFCVADTTEEDDVCCCPPGFVVNSAGDCVREVDTSTPDFTGHCAAVGGSCETLYTCDANLRISGMNGNALADCEEQRFEGSVCCCSGGSEPDSNGFTCVGGTSTEGDGTTDPLGSFPRDRYNSQTECESNGKAWNANAAPNRCCGDQAADAGLVILTGDVEHLCQAKEDGSWHWVSANSLSTSAKGWVDYTRIGISTPYYIDLLPKVLPLKDSLRFADHCSAITETDGLYTYPEGDISAGFVACNPFGDEFDLGSFRTSTSPLSCPDTLPHELPLFARIKPDGEFTPIEDSSPGEGSTDATYVEAKPISLLQAVFQSEQLGSALASCDSQFRAEDNSVQTDVCAQDQYCDGTIIQSDLDAPGDSRYCCLGSCTLSNPSSGEINSFPQFMCTRRNDIGFWAGCGRTAASLPAHNFYLGSRPTTFLDFGQEAFGSSSSFVKPGSNFIYNKVLALGVKERAASADSIRYKWDIESDPLAYSGGIMSDWSSFDSLTFYYKAVQKPNAYSLTIRAMVGGSCQTLNSIPINLGGSVQKNKWTQITIPLDTIATVPNSETGAPEIRREYLENICEMEFALLSVGNTFNGIESFSFNVLSETNQYKDIIFFDAFTLITDDASSNLYCSLDSNDHYSWTTGLTGQACNEQPDHAWINGECCGLDSTRSYNGGDDPNNAGYSCFEGEAIASDTLAHDGRLLNLNGQFYGIPGSANMDGIIDVRTLPDSQKVSPTWIGSCIQPKIGSLESRHYFDQDSGIFRLVPSGGIPSCCGSALGNVDQQEISSNLAWNPGTSCFSGTLDSAKCLAPTSQVVVGEKGEGFNPSGEDNVAVCTDIGGVPTWTDCDVNDATCGQCGLTWIASENICCGNDGGEIAKHFVGPGAEDSTDVACCSDPGKCVNNGVCYDNNAETVIGGQQVSCTLGAWTLGGSLSCSPNGECGSCEGNQCFTGTEAGCVAPGYTMNHYACSNGQWQSLSNLIVREMNTMIGNSDDYAMICDDPGVIFNWINYNTESGRNIDDYLDQVIASCVLRRGDQVIIGAALQNSIQGGTLPFTSAIGISDCQNALDSAGSGNYHRCTAADAQVYYNPDSRIVFFSNQDIQSGSDSFSTSALENLNSFLRKPLAWIAQTFSSEFEEGALFDPSFLRQAEDSPQLFVSKNGVGRVYGSTSGDDMSVTYRCFEDLCDEIRRYGANVDCEFDDNTKTTFVAAQIPSGQTRHLQLWKWLTSSIRSDTIAEQSSDVAISLSQEVGEISIDEGISEQRLTIALDSCQDSIGEVTINWGAGDPTSEQLSMSLNGVRTESHIYPFFSGEQPVTVSAGGTSETIILRKHPLDFNNDGIVELATDYLVWGPSFGSAVGDPNYNVRFDIFPDEPDGKIDFSDFVQLSTSYGNLVTDNS